MRGGWKGKFGRFLEVNGKLSWCVDGSDGWISSVYEPSKSVNYTPGAAIVSHAACYKAHCLGVSTLWNYYYITLK